MAETADLKSLARRVLQRDTHRDTVRDGVSHGWPAQAEPPRQAHLRARGADGTAAIQNPTGQHPVYRKNNKPAFGPLGDSLDDLVRGP